MLSKGLPMTLKVFYRISDRSYLKPKLPGADKFVCYESFREAFPEANITIIADHTHPDTKEYFCGLDVIQTELGNAASLRYAIKWAIDEAKRYDFVYFAEDDYLYRKGASSVLMEGAELADYVTLYDHPDKYTKQYRMGEISQVRRTKSSHWRYTLSTCMTFGVWTDILKHDLNFWQEYTKGDHPNDHQVFADLNGANRKLAVSIPGWACHTDLTFSGAVQNFLIDDWAVEQMIQKLEKSVEAVKDPNFQDLYRRMQMPSQNWQKLQMLEAMLNLLPK